MLTKKTGILVPPASFNLILVGSVFNALQGSVNSFIWSEDHICQLSTRIPLFSTARNVVDLQTQKVSAQEDSAVLWVFKLFKLAMTISLDFFIRVESLPPGLILSLQIRHQPDRKMIFYEMIFYEIIFSAYQIPAWQRNNIFCNDILWNISSLQIKYQPGRETEHNKTGTCVTEQVEHRQKSLKAHHIAPAPIFFGKPVINGIGPKSQHTTQMN